MHLSFSTKVTFFAPLEIHSIPKEPIPEYTSSISAFSKLVLISLECFNLLKILSLTESFRGLVVVFFK